MGHTWYGDIQDFWPDDTDTTFYLTNTHTINEIIDRAKEKFGSDISLDDISISTEYIHTSCLGHDRYDPSDYTTFIVIEKIAR